jgi:predicted Zn-ribbon and HTH transcriptional regulator
MATSKTTVAGYVNKHGQENLGSTGRPGDHNQTVYKMKCRECGHVYGANGADIFQKKCPKCQGGTAGPGL